MFTGVAVELDAGNRIFTTLPVVPVDRTGGTNKAATLDFAHFANGTGITSSLVFVNVSAPRRAGPFTLAGQLVRPAIYFYDKRGNPIAAESVVDVLGDLEVTGDGALTVQTAIESLGELTISTHGQGELVTGSVNLEHLTLRVDTYLHEVPPDPDSSILCLRTFCSTVKGSVVVLMPGKDCFGVAVGILGQYLAMVNVPANTESFPNEGVFAWGHVVSVIDKKLNRCSWMDSLIRTPECLRML